MKRLNNMRTSEFVCYKILLIFSFLLILSISHAQTWNTMSRMDKDSVIYHHYDKGNKYVGIGLSGTLLAGGWHGFSYKIEPAAGYFLFNRQLFSCSIIFEKAETQYEEQYKKSQQIRAGITYRYYLPERKILHLFFGQVSIYEGNFKGQQNPDGIEENISVSQMTIAVSAGIAFSVNKYNLELALSHDYELLNQKIINDYFAGGSYSFIRFSYAF